ncbi:hypothetical protein [Desertivirga arenae]|uniref:hypothetical protein n=1 Tax=Desertivirga arenae TaxID=2810309 RepID=UPI001A95C1F8|nr:hypothetical protein [Pedobacter sp. SYSU D00823]
MHLLFASLETKVKSFCEHFPNYHETTNAASTLLNEIDYQRNELENVLHGALSEEDLKEFTRIYHLGILELIAELLKRTGKEPSRNRRRFDLKSALKTENTGKVLDGLHQLFTFIHCHFEGFIPKEKPIPSSCHSPLIMEIKEGQRYIARRLKNVEAELSEMVIKPFIQFVKFPKKQTWHNFYYCSTFANEFRILAAHSKEITDTDLIKFLFFINFNSMDFYTYYLEQLTEKGLVLAELYFLKKELALMPVKPKVALNPEINGVVDQLKTYVQEEIYYLEHTGKSVMDDPAKNRNNADDVPTRFVYNISVERLGLRYRVDVELNVIDRGQPEKFYILIANTSSTPGSTYPSVKNIKNDYFKPTVPTIQAELNYHQKAIEFLKKEKIKACRSTGGGGGS